METLQNLSEKKITLITIAIISIAFAVAIGFATGNLNLTIGQ